MSIFYIFIRLLVDKSDMTDERYDNSFLCKSAMKMYDAQQRAETTKALGLLCEYCTCYDSLNAFILVTHFKSAHDHF